MGKDVLTALGSIITNMLKVIRVRGIMAVMKMWIKWRNFVKLARSNF